MLNKLIKMAKNGMFDTAFLLAEKHNLYNELFDSLRKNHNITLDKLKYLVNVENTDDLTFLDICYNLKILICNYPEQLDYINKIHLDYTNKIHLEKLFYTYNKLTHIDVSNLPKLKSLYCYGNSLKTIDLKNNTLLECLDVSHNQIEELNLINNPNLSALLCYGNNHLKEIKLNKQVEGKIYINNINNVKITYNFQ